MNQRGLWQLILMAREGDRQAIDELFYSTFRPAYLILYAITADKHASLDILAQGYLEIFQNLDALETGSDFGETLNRFVISRAKALFPSKEFLHLPDGCEAESFGFRQDPPQIHDFDTLPALQLSARADEILDAFHSLPLEQQICAYLFYYVQLQPDRIADLLSTHENKVCGTLQQARQGVLPRIEVVLRKSPAFRGTDAESAIPWALRRTEQYAPLPAEMETCRQTVLDKLVADEILDVTSQEELEPEPEFQMQNIAPPKEHVLLHRLFSLPTLICVLVLLIAVGAVIGVRQLHAYNARRSNLENQTDRTTLTMQTTSFTPERVIFSTEFEAPTEPETTEPPEPETTEPVATTEAPTVTEPTTPVITTASPYSDFATLENGNNVTITGYSGTKTNVEVPAQIDGKTVNAIGENAFFNSSITAIKLPSSIRSIGKNAFHSCTSLGSISLPAGITTIESNAFRGCTGLKAVTLPSSLKKLGAQAFYQCSALASIALPTSLTSIGDWAFAYCTNLTGMAIPGSVTTMGSSVFYECKSLSRCSIESTTRLSALGDSTFFDCTSLKSFTIPSTVKAVPANCFVGCRSMTSVTIPSAVTTIGQNAFADCVSLSGVKLSSNLRKIESGAFSGCTGLKDVTIPKGTTSIGESAFSGCTSLRTITIPDSVTTIGAKAFYHCDELVISCPEDSAAEKYADANHIDVAGRSTAKTTYDSDSTSE